MATIKKYTKKDGSTAYMFNAYLGVDPLTGKPKRTTRRGFKKPKDAKLALAQLQLEVESQGFIKQDYSTFKDVYELWFAQYKNTVKPPSVHRVNTYFKKHILPVFGDLKLSKITTAYCQHAVNKWADENKSFGAIKRYTNKVLDFAVTQQLASDNPMSRIVMPRRKREIKSKDEQNFLDKNQLKNFLKLAEEREDIQYYSIFQTLAYTGLRKSELAALTWDDVSFKDASLSVNKNVAIVSGKQYISTTKTTSSDRVISLDTNTLSILKKWKLEQRKLLLSRGIRIKNNTEQLIFSSDKNEIMPAKILWDKLKKYKEFNITPHGFRHTHASLLFEAGASVKEVQERLGHSDIKTTLNIYTHVTKDAEKGVAEKFMSYMNL